MLALRFAEHSCPSTHPAAHIVRRIQESAQEFDQLIWQHSLREGNRLADCFAKKGLEMQGEFRVFGTIPNSATLLYVADSAGSLIKRGS
ncbi:Reverse transcriptase-like [Sesbania bispinosa]|nr:Reverse transcriptase-like [Sesbania bispinosa]